MPNRNRDRGPRGKHKILDRRTALQPEVEPSTGSSHTARFSRNEAITLLYQAFHGRFSRELVSDVLANKGNSVADALESLKGLCQDTGPPTSGSQAARPTQLAEGGVFVALKNHQIIQAHLQKQVLPVIQASCTACQLAFASCMARSGQTGRWQTQEISLNAVG